MKPGGPLKRRTRLNSSTALSPGRVRLKRTAMKRVGKRREREAEALAEFTKRPKWTACDECGAAQELWVGWDGELYRPGMEAELTRIDAHHLCSRARGAGHPMLHDTRNRAWLCRACHDKAHRGELPHLIKSRDYLDTLT